MAQARVLTERELRKVLNYCNTQPHSARNRSMLLCTHLAGMRVGEVAALCICNGGCVWVVASNKHHSV